MNLFPKLAEKYIEGKAISQEVKRIIGLLCCIFIAHLFYKSSYPNYTWIAITDYKAIFSFLLNGKFLVPLVYFLPVLFISYGVPYGIFSVANNIATRKALSDIEAVELDNNDVKEGLELLQKVINYLSPIRISEKKMIELYDELTTEMTSEELKKINDGINSQKMNSSESFIVAFRTLVAIVMLQLTTGELGWALFTTILLLGVIYMLYLMYTYRFCDILPVLAKKFHTKAKVYVKTQLATQPISNSPLQENSQEAALEGQLPVRLNCSVS